MTKGEVYFAPLSVAARRWSDEKVLSDQEQTEIQRFRTSALREQRRLSRSILRSLLGSVLGCCANEVVFSTNGYGKLQVQDGRVHFNVAHTNELVGVVLSSSPVGIDIEAIRPLDDWEQVARRILHPSEEEALRTINAPEARRRAFFRLWVRKEAVAKAIGLGLGDYLNQIDACRDHVVFPAEECDDGWFINDILVPWYLHVGAVATCGGSHMNFDTFLLTDRGWKRVQLYV